MSWLFPGFLAGAAAIALPILLHLLRRRPKRTIRFPALRFLMATQKRSKSQWLQRWLVLLLRCAALALLAGAFARPFMGAFSGGDHQAVVVVIDNSFSLRAGRHWNALRYWAGDQIAGMAPTDKVGLLVMAPRPTWLAPMNTGAEAAQSLLNELTPGWDVARSEPALQLAADTLAATAADRRRIVYLGDHQRVSWAGFDFGKEFPPGVRAVFPRVPDPLARQAAVRAPTITRTSSGFHAVVSVQNYTNAQDRRLSVYRDGGTTPILQQPIALQELETQTLEIDLPIEGDVGSAYFSFSLDDDDLPTDDQAFGVWQSINGSTVLLDAAPRRALADYVDAALTSTAELEPAMEITPTPVTAWPSHAVAVLRNEASFSGESAARLNAFLRAGGSALIFVDGSGGQLAWLAEIMKLPAHLLKTDAETLEVRDWSIDHPLVAGLASHSVRALLDWKFSYGCALPTELVEPLALWPEGETAIGEVNGNAGHLLICGFAADRRDSEWPAREAFVPFVHRAVAYLLGGQTGGAVRPAQVGQSLVLPAQSGTWRALAGPAAGNEVNATSGAITPTTPGVYEFSFGAERELFAVNLAPEESDPAAWSDGTPWLDLESDQQVIDLPESQVALSAVEAERQGPLWWWLVAAMAVVMLAELGFANRTSR